jgi:hypothetical protein
VSFRDVAAADEADVGFHEEFAVPGYQFKVRKKDSRECGFFQTRSTVGTDSF